MPLILLPEQEKLWIDGDVPTKDVIHNIQPVPGDYITWYRVSDRVNNVRENDEGLILAV
jgi:putative SOS response-associated peptidase YedK